MGYRGQPNAQEIAKSDAGGFVYYSDGKEEPRWQQGENRNRQR